MSVGGATAVRSVPAWPNDSAALGAGCAPLTHSHPKENPAAPCASKPATEATSAATVEFAAALIGLRIGQKQDSDLNHLHLIIRYFATKKGG